MIYEDGRRYMRHNSDEVRVFEVEKKKKTTCCGVYAGYKGYTTKKWSGVLTADNADENIVLMKCTLLKLHKRLGHLMYDSVEKMADSEGPGIELTDRSRPSCLTCDQGKQSKYAQAK